MAKIVDTIEIAAQRIAEVQTEKILLIYCLCEIINEIAREVEFDLKGQGQLRHEDKRSIEQIKLHSDRMSIGASRIISEEKSIRFGKIVDTIKPMIYDGLELPESAASLIED
jgi:hypothetical protein